MDKFSKINLAFSFVRGLKLTFRKLKKIQKDFVCFLTIPNLPIT